MGIKTRIDKRSENGNDKFYIVDDDMFTLATITALSGNIQLEVGTVEGLHVYKENGYHSGDSHDRTSK